ncbi:calcium-activated chloride channel regulator 1 [Lingula anatina]|uniref:Calcium-activated chloride channel regulator 1 n=1 Tax=Lingula anatina TaxID=7574 RepID=A0A1S3HH73_LINAN|nr:calcium-activated chloride channel regulator 1 [Lingula anatina]|eukprot:XP_013385433.1 calcium-activated chloride channel regulator 1 [Lingula anatina]
MIFLLLTTAFLAADARKSKVTLVNNGYKGLVVGIHRDVTENPEIVNKIKEYITELSRDLLRSTNNRAYIQNVTILVPSTWTTYTNFDRDATSELFTTSNIIVDHESEQYGDNPYVKQVLPCGDHGENMHLTTGYLLTPRTEVENKFGPIGKTLVHHWGHLRWGLFDEFPVTAEGYPRFYHDNQGNVEAVRCSLKVKGQAVQPSSQQPCQIDSATGLPVSDCVFSTPDTGQMATGSVMDRYSLSNIYTFCDNDASSPNNLHNIEAPSKQNRLCSMKSAWEIMRDHPDFKDGVNPPLTDTEVAGLNTTPSFTVVKEGKRRYVLVLDMSHSMAENNRLINMVKALRDFILYTVSDGSYVGIVRFYYKADILCPMTEITSYEVRLQVVDTLQPDLFPYTSLGTGLRNGLKALENAQDITVPGATLVLFSDGDNTLEPDIEMVQPEIVQNQVSVDTVLITKEATDHMIPLAEDTGGTPLYASEALPVIALTESLTYVVTSREESPVLQLQGLAISVASSQQFNGSVHIDEDIGVNTNFIFSWNPVVNNEVVNVSVVLTKPDGEIIEPNSTAYNLTYGFVTIPIEGLAMAGRWQYTVDCDTIDEIDINVRVTSTARDGVDPIKLTGEVNEGRVNFSDPDPTPIIILADLRRKFSPVVNANVTATVDTDYNATYLQTFTLKLHDDGLGADVTAGDGVYSGYFLDIPDTGRYRVRVLANNNPNTAQLKVHSPPTRNAVMAEAAGAPENLPVTYRPLGQFDRAVYAGFVIVTLPSGVEMSDVYPPLRISDLRVSKTSYDNDSVVLMWTASGEALDRGTALKYEVRYATTHQQFLDDWDSCTAVTPDMVSHGDLLNPLPSGKIETMVVSFPPSYSTRTLVFGVKALNSVKKSEMSNLASAIILPNLNATSPVPTDNPVVQPEDPGNDILIIIAAGAGGFLILLIIIIVIIIIALRNRRKRREELERAKKDLVDGKEMECGEMNMNISVPPDILMRTPSVEYPDGMGYTLEYESHEIQKTWGIYKGGGALAPNGTPKPRENKRDLTTIEWDQPNSKDEGNFVFAGPGMAEPGRRPSQRSRISNGSAVGSQAPRASVEENDVGRNRYAKNWKNARNSAYSNRSFQRD